MCQAINVYSVPGERTWTRNGWPSVSIVLINIQHWAWAAHQLMTVGVSISWLEHEKTNKMTCLPSEGSDHTAHLYSLIRVFAVCMKKPWVHGFPVHGFPESVLQRLIRLSGYPGWSFSLGAQVIFLVLSWSGSFVIVSLFSILHVLSLRYYEIIKKYFLRTVWMEFLFYMVMV